MEKGESGTQEIRKEERENEKCKNRKGKQ